MRHRAVLTVAALALLASGCSLGTKPSISVQQVPVDLAFGGKKATPTPVATPAPQPRPSFPTFVFVPPPDLPPLPPVVPETRETCEPPSPFPQEPAPPSVGAENQPELGRYRFAYERAEGRKTVKSNGFRTIEDLRLETRGPDNIGFSYLVRDSLTRVALRLRAETVDPTRGLYLSQLRFPEGEREATATFQVPLQLLAFPLQAGETVTATGIDPVSQSVVTSEVTLLPRDPGKDRVKACDEVVDAWRMSWSLVIQGVSDQSWDGTFWIATQWGGWPVADQVAYDGDFVIGSFSSRILETTPLEPEEEGQ